MRPFCLVAGVVVLLLRWATVPCAAWAQVATTITVDQRGGGQYTTVQAAVDAVPEGNSRWVRIYVRQGSYREKVRIPSRKGFILLQGDSPWNTDINFDAHAAYDAASGVAENITDYSSTYNSATFTVQADNFVARGISFRNTYGGFDSPAVAALVGGDKSAFYDCAFHGYQDTLCDFTGRHYFRRCLVEGGVDFIFGFGRSVYEDCTLLSNMPAWSRQPGWVTAHGWAGPDSDAALVFKGGQIVGSGRQYLGRPWKQQATVVFFQVAMTGIVVPQGWEKWNSTQDVSQVTFAEVACTGPGSDTAGRVPWEKHLSYGEVQRFVDIRFIDDGWLSNQP